MDSSLLLLVGGLVLAGASGMPGLLSRRDSRWGQRLATCLTLTGSLAGLAGAGLVLGGAVPADWRGLGADALSAWFLVPIFLIGGLGALYGETPVDLQSSLPRGDDRCITSIES